MKKDIIKRLIVTGVYALVGLLLIPAVVGVFNQNAEPPIDRQASTSITISSPTNVAMPALSPAERAVTSSAMDKVFVSTNSSAGYSLFLADGDAVTALTNADNVIASHSAATLSSPSELAVNTWGYAVAGGEFDASYSMLNSSASATAKFAGVPASGRDAVLKVRHHATEHDETIVWYGAKVDAAKPTGIYSNSVTYTAIAN